MFFYLYNAKSYKNIEDRADLWYHVKNSITAQKITIIRRIFMDIRHLDPNPTGSSEGTKSVLREAMEAQKKEVKLKGDLCLDDSDPNLVLIWSKAEDSRHVDHIVCWKVTNPEAEEMKDMVSAWEEFVVLSADGRPLGTARDYFLTK